MYIFINELLLLLVQFLIVFHSYHALVIYMHIIIKHGIWVGWASSNLLIGLIIDDMMKGKKHFYI